jgi:hypothetical protein
LTLSAGINSQYLVGGTTALTLTSDRKLYWCIGPTFGVPGAGGSLTGGWILSGSQSPPPEKVNSFVSAWSVGLNGMVPAAGGLGPAIGVEMGDPGGNWRDWSNYAIEPGIGVGTPSVQVQATYCFGPIYQFGKDPWPWEPGYQPGYDPGGLNELLRRLFGPKDYLPPVDGRYPPTLWRGPDPL